MERLPISRRGFLTILGLLGTGVVLDRYVLPNLPPLGGDGGMPDYQAEPDQTDIALFPRAKTIRSDFIHNLDNVANIIQASRTFPQYAATAPEDSNMPIREVPIDVDPIYLAKLGATRVRLLLAFDLVAINLDFNENILFGPDFSTNRSTPWPAFLAVVDKEENTRDAIKVTAGYSPTTKDNTRTGSLESLSIAFYTTSDEISGKDFVLFFNRGLFKHQQETAMILPVRFNVSIPQSPKGPIL